jgi:SAM-dependent methyltransferase
VSFYTEFADHYESIFPFSKGVYAFLKQYISAPPERVLDVGCGTGHYAGQLAGDGYEAVGIDLDTAMIAYAVEHYPEAVFRVLDMVEIEKLARRFGAVACIGNTAAHLTRVEFEGFIDAVRKVLTPGGPFVLQVMNWDYVLTQSMVTFPVIEGEGDVVFYRAYQDISETQVTFATRLAVRGVTIFEDAVPLYPMWSADIIAAAAVCGFKLIAQAGSYGGTPFDAGVFSANILVFR